jgi:haloalkane dehalogenase|tara:strand:+ start:586 stop:1458 length:873 start_codon:yes stop_codon:yes gene_type:complete
VSEGLPSALKALYPFSSSWIDQPGGRQHYIDVGEGHPVIMVHGNPTWSFYYRDLARAVADQGMRAIVPDHLGCGLSDKPQDWSYCLADHIENVLRLIKELGLTRFSIVVHDWGGAIGMGVATELSEAVERIVVLNTAAFRSKRLPLRIAACRWPFIGRFLVRGLNGFAGPATRMTTVQPLSRDLKDGYLWPYRSWADRIAIARFVEDIPMNENHPSYDRLVKVEEGLTSLREKPMLIAWGGRDWCFNASFFREWQARFPEAQTHWKQDCGHYVLEDGGDELHQQIAQFLK